MVSSEFDGDTTWRIIDTDTELPTGVAPACPLPDVHAMMHGGPATDTAIYDECCATVGPHLECWSEYSAIEVCAMLNRLRVEVCS